MKETTREWVAKAEGDFLTAEREFTAKKPNYDATCFHTQQCAEKYLKAWLNEHGVRFQKTHDLLVLLELALPVDQAFETLRPTLAYLTYFAFEFRYPGEWADEQSARSALEHCRSIRNRARRSLGFPLLKNGR